MDRSVDVNARHANLIYLFHIYPYLAQAAALAMATLAAVEQPPAPYPSPASTAPIANVVIRGRGFWSWMMWPRTKAKVRYA